MTVRHRRRSFQAEAIAPWVALSVILLLWWAGARTLNWMIPGRSVQLSDQTIERAVPVMPSIDRPHSAAPVRSEPAVPTIAPLTSVSNRDLTELRQHHLLIPVKGLTADDLVSSFSDARGKRVHEAIDILAPRNTEVLAVEDGRVAKLFTSVAGGITVYQFDPSEAFVYYYAHLNGYASGLKEGQELKKGDVVGYVGTTGNAPESTPHLHFAISKLNPDKRWWGGTALDPFLVWRDASAN